MTTRIIIINSTLLNTENTKHRNDRKMVRTKTNTHTRIDIYAHRSVFWNQSTHTDREVTENGPAIIIKNKRGDNMHNDKCGNASGQKLHAKIKRKEIKCKSLSIEKNECET